MLLLWLPLQLADLGLDLWQTFLALFLIVVGFITFYVIPYAFTFGTAALGFLLLLGPRSRGVVAWLRVSVSLAPCLLLSCFCVASLDCVRRRC